MHTGTTILGYAVNRSVHKGVIPNKTPKGKIAAMAGGGRKKIT